MKLLVPVLVLLVAWFVLGGPNAPYTSVVVDPVPEPRSGPSRWDEYMERWNEAERAVARLDPNEHPDWVGVWCTPEPWPYSLALTPDSFVAFQSDYCGVGIGYRAWGSLYEVEPGELRLELEHRSWVPTDSHRKHRDSFQVDERLFLVDWGELRFAVPAWRMERFCARVNAGGELPGMPIRKPRHAGDSWLEELERPSGLPCVPEAYRHLLLEEPIVARLVRRMGVWPQGDWVARSGCCFEATWEVDAGRNEGLAVGMQLFVPMGTRAERLGGYVEAVFDETAHVTFVNTADELDQRDALIGLRASTYDDSLR